jgi:hypothetical protein
MPQQQQQPTAKTISEAVSDIMYTLTLLERAVRVLDHRLRMQENLHRHVPKQPPVHLCPHAWDESVS